MRGLPLIAAAGQLVPRKGFDTLINAFAQVAPHHPQWRLRIFGRGPEHARLQDLVHAHGLSDAVRLMGALPDLTAEWDKAAFAVSAARRESFGLTMVEAMHHGLPVLAADAPFGPGEIVVPGRNGILVPVGDEEAMAQAMRYLIEQPAEREKLSQGAYATAPLYSAERIAFRYDAFLRDVVASVPKDTAAAPAPVVPSGVPAEVLVRGDGAIEVRAVLHPGAEPPRCVLPRAGPRRWSGWLPSGRRWMRRRALCGRCTRSPPNRPSSPRAVMTSTWSYRTADASRSPWRASTPVVC